MKRLLLIPLLAATACQSTTPQLSDNWGALPILDRVEVEYRGSVRVSADDAMKIPDFEATAVEDVESARAWQVRAGFVELSSQAVARLVGNSVMTEGQKWGAGIVSLEEMQQTISSLIESGDGVMISDPSMVVHEGTRATVTIANQTAFVDHFDFEPTPESILMDPEVGAFLDGLLLDVRPLGIDDKGRARVEVGVTWSELIEMQEVETDYPLDGLSVTMQVPVFMRQDLNGLVGMGPDQAVVLPVLYGDQGKRMLVILRVDVVDENTAGSGISPAPEQRESEAKASGQ